MRKLNPSGYIGGHTCVRTYYTMLYNNGKAVKHTLRVPHFGKPRLRDFTAGLIRKLPKLMHNMQSACN